MILISFDRVVRVLSLFIRPAFTSVRRALGGLPRTSDIEHDNPPPFESLSPGSGTKRVPGTRAPAEQGHDLRPVNTVKACRLFAAGYAHPMAPYELTRPMAPVVQTDPARPMGAAE